MKMILRKAEGVAVCLLAASRQLVVCEGLEVCLQKVFLNENENLVHYRKRDSTFRTCKFNFLVSQSEEIQTNLTHSLSRRLDIVKFIHNAGFSQDPTLLGEEKQRVALPKSAN